MDATGGWQVVDVRKLVGDVHRRLVGVNGKQVLLCINIKTKPNQVD